MRSTFSFLAVVFFGALMFAGAAVNVAHGVSAPVLDDVVPLSACGLELQWTQPDAADSFSYDVKVGAGSWNPNNPLPGSCATFPCSLTNLFDAEDGIRPEEVYSFRLYAFKSGEGLAGPSGEVSDTTPPVPAAPAPPTDLRVVEWSTVSGPVVLTWTPSSEPDNSGFRVFRERWDGTVWVPETVGGGTFSLGAFTGNGNEWSDATSPDAAYRYRVQTYQSAQYCPVVDDASQEADYFVNFSGDSYNLVVPSRPVSVVANSQNQIEYTFSWANVEKETGYELQFRVNSGAWQIHSYGADVTSSTLFALGNNNTIDFHVRALWGDISHSSWREGSQFITGMVAPTGLEARIVYATSDAGGTADVHFAWTDSAAYHHTTRIYRRPVGDEWGTPIAELAGVSCLEASPDTEYFDENVSLGNGYEYKVVFAVYDGCPKIIVGGSGDFTVETSAVIRTVNLDMRYVLRGTGWSLAQPEYGIGWIKFNSLGDAANVYSVQIDSGGLMSGEAWAGEDYGWLTFHTADLAGCLSGTCEARVNLSTGEFSGWARFMNAEENWEGWDGWVKLRGTVTGDGSYGASFADTSEPITNIKGLAWGDEVAGWIAFNNDFCENCTVQAVRLNEPPEVTVSSISAVDMCEVTPRILVSGSYSDEDKNPPQSVNVQFYLPGSGVVAHESGLLANGATSTSGGTMTINDSGDGVGNFTYSLPNPLGYGAGAYSDAPLLRNTNYTVRIKAYDGYDETEEWVTAGYATPLSYHPLVDFSESADPSGRIVIFTDTTDGRSSGWSSRTWMFSGATPATSAVSNPTVVFNTFLNNPDAELKWTNGDLLCSALQNWTGGGNDVPGNPEAPGSVKRRIFREL